MEEMLAAHRAYFRSGQARDVAARVDALKRLRLSLKRHEGELLRALGADLGKGPSEAYMTELGIVYEELKNAIRYTRLWSRTKYKLPSISQFPGHGRVLRDPYGVVLILAPWNYPLQLTLTPLIAAVAAGNCAVVRPSSSAPNTASAVAGIIKESFSPGHVSCVLGGSSTAAALTSMRFDKIFFTGSPGVGREVMRAASENLVPVTLELGGKSPAIVTADADIQLAARRIVWGKFLNAGQTCVAPDYVLVSASVEDELLDALHSEIRKQFGTNPLLNRDLPSIINNHHFDRLIAMLDNGRLVCGGQIDPEYRLIEPTVLAEIEDDDPLMEDEIFGPILPVMTFHTIEEALQRVRSLPAPLAFYLFTSNRESARHIMRDTVYGGGCVNDCVVHIAGPRLPFGGVGNSGMGAYHGKYGFACFSREKGVLHASTRLDLPVRYPPWKGKLSTLRRIMK